MFDTESPYADTSSMYSVHAMFRREFALLPALVRSGRDQDRARRETVVAHIRMVNLVLHHHHAGEDRVMYQLLADRAPREIDPVLRLVEGHHRGMDELLTTIDLLLSAWPRGTVAEDDEALAVALERLAVVLYLHTDLEEQLVLPIAEAHILASEWEQMVADEAATIPPEIGPVLAGMLMYEGGIEVVPPEMRSVLAELAPKAYAAHCEAVHGTPTPPRSTEVGIGAPYVGVTAGA